MAALCKVQQISVLQCFVLVQIFAYAVLEFWTVCGCESLLVQSPGVCESLCWHHTGPESLVHGKGLQCVLTTVW